MAKVLLVDDDDHYRNELASKLESNGVEICAARNGEEGLTHLKKGGIDIVVLDLAMPKMDGITFYYYLEDTYKSKIPVIIVTSASHAAYPSNVTDFINKEDFTISEIVEKIRAHIDN